MKSCKVIREFHRTEIYTGELVSDLPATELDRTKQTIFIVVSNSGAEVFDLLAPYHIFSLTHRFNIFIVAPEKRPVPLWKGLFILPHFNFEEVEQANADLIVIPALQDAQDTEVVNWIKKKKSPDNMILSICEGSRTVCETGLYQGRDITSHSSAIVAQEKKYRESNWIRGVRFAGDKGYYSTAGVSSAVEGTLAIIELLLGKQEAVEVSRLIQYPYDSIRRTYSFMKFGFSDKLSVLAKTMFRKNKEVGIFLQDGVDELMLGAIIDSYNRTFPQSLKTFCSNREYVKSKNGLILFPNTTQSADFTPDELHVLSSISNLSPADQEAIRALQVELGKEVEMVCYYNGGYIFSVVLERIENLYGNRFKKTIQRLLDYPSDQN